MCCSLKLKDPKTFIPHANEQGNHRDGSIGRLILEKHSWIHRRLRVTKHDSQAFPYFGRKRLLNFL